MEDDEKKNGGVQLGKTTVIDQLILPHMVGGHGASADAVRGVVQPSREGRRTANGEGPRLRHRELSRADQEKGFRCRDHVRREGRRSVIRLPSANRGFMQERSTILYDTSILAPLAKRSWVLAVQRLERRRTSPHLKLLDLPPSVSGSQPCRANQGVGDRRARAYF